MIRLTALMDDKPSEHLKLATEHGLSFYMEAGGKKLLFDCAATGATLSNARNLGIRLDLLDAVVLSHSHYDHSAGYRALIESGLGNCVLFTGPLFFERKYAKDESRLKDLSCGFDCRFLSEHGIQYCQIESVAEIFPGIWLLSGFKRTHAFEIIPARFVRQTGGRVVQDEFPDEICLAVQVNGGLAVLVGCSHPGILNIISHVRETLNQPVRMVFGGTHLLDADEKRVRQTIGELKSLGLKVLGLSHCSGEAADCMIRNDPEIFGRHLATGDTTYFE